MVNVIMVMIFVEDDEESGFDKDDGNQTLYLVFQSVKSIASSSRQRTSHFINHLKVRKDCARKDQDLVDEDVEHQSVVTGDRE